MVCFSRIWKMRAKQTMRYCCSRQECTVATCARPWMSLLTFTVRQKVFGEPHFDITSPAHYTR